MEQDNQVKHRKKAKNRLEQNSVVKGQQKRLKPPSPDTLAGEVALVRQVFERGRRLSITYDDRLDITMAKSDSGQRPFQIHRRPRTSPAKPAVRVNTENQPTSPVSSKKLLQLKFSTYGINSAGKGSNLKQTDITLGRLAGCVPQFIVMVSTYKRKSDRQKWSAESMKQAIEKVFTGVMGLRKASDAYNVPKTTLKTKSSQEEELATYVKDMESRFFGLTTKDLRSLAYDLAEKNKLKHIFDKGTKMAGRYWLESFLRRNPDLSVRKPEATSAARASGFNKVAVRKFFLAGLQRNAMRMVGYKKDIFTKWFQKFITFSRASKNTPVLLLLDGHASHTKNLDVINLARANGVHIISFPPHCTHRLQPLDVGFLKPLSTYYSDAAKQWLRTNPGRIITQFQIAELVNKAFERSATIPIAHNAFRATGIWPPNPDIFTDADFLAADTTEIDENEQVAQQIDEPQPYAAAREEISDSDDEPLANLRQGSNQDSPSARSFLISPAQIMPIPKNKQTKRVTKRRGKTAIITSSPYRQELQEIQNKGNQVKRRLDVDESRGKGSS
ncbi:hypothetical protein NQ317_004091 [Molorchus minor]|uniref:HTH CENPB-type domain-containing protein n=1 Tax=Molorchus minor TaxID=1323400 RepID=A0ABQ9JVP2_9CUCU|nr:hypothetical protein NQ317_004091 [Molorchus minor]